MAPFFANQSCDPFTDRTLPCTLGNYVRYSVDVTSASDVEAALKFAVENNIRVVIRNTGHDFLGRSTGAGALGLWMHSLKSMSIVDWHEPSFSGTAIRIGAGVLGGEALEFASANGRTVVTGECPTVGIVGGYTQGGGHSVLSSKFGLAADQVLEWDVVTSDGVHMKASRQQNEDLFWALCGGGGSTYAVVLGMTVRSYPDVPIAGFAMSMSSSQVSEDDWYNIIGSFNKLVPQMTAQGAMILYQFSSKSFTIAPFTLYGGTEEQIEAMVSPWLKQVESLGITYTRASATSTNNYNYHDTWLGPLPGGAVKVSLYQVGSRLIDIDTIKNRNDEFTSVLRNIISRGAAAVISATNAQPPEGASLEDTAVLPAWRSAAMHMNIASAWNSAPDKWQTMLEDQRLMTSDFVPRLNKVTPDSGTYMNEADFRQPTWKKDFFGDNYERLLQVKQSYDPRGLLWATKTVGSDAWTVDEQTGRMCRS
ncbi:fad binding domain-containing protein [Ceratocystis lukuohia]|uniref:Fad binding domain-containing protein n=1 Tax=Ceratocystis lukuohia TaxID=2019550 RepID=A0ABR4MAH9_9PEZI